MRRALRSTLAVTAILALSACTSDYQPGWTFSPATPAPSVSADPSGEPSGSAPPSEPSPSASDGPVQPSASASVAPSDQASVPPDGGDAILISALNIAFEQAAVEAPADTAFTIRFENKDAGVPHNVEIKDAAGTSLYTGEIFNGVDTRDYQIDPLTAGDYQFICTVHPNMVGTLTAG